MGAVYSISHPVLPRICHIMVSACQVVTPNSCHPSVVRCTHIIQRSRKGYRPCDSWDHKGSVQCRKSLGYHERRFGITMEDLECKRRRRICFCRGRRPAEKGVTLVSCYYRPSRGNLRFVCHASAEGPKILFFFACACQLWFAFRSVPCQL